MGAKNQKVEEKPVQSMEEILLDMRMAAKRFEMDARRAEKEKAKQYQKAQEAIKKNNEEGAKMYLLNYNQKDNEMKNMQRMAQKMDALQMSIKSNASSVVMMEQIKKITPILTNQSSQISTELVYSDMLKFESAMDEIIVTGKVMDEVLNKNGKDIQSDQAVDSMLSKMKLEHLDDIQNKLAGDNMQIFQQIKQDNQQIPNNQLKQQKLN